MAEVPAVCVFGNGLSIEYSDSLAISNLTRELRAAINNLGREEGVADDLVEFSNFLSAEVAGANPDQNFERLVGPLDQLADALIPLERAARALQAAPSGQAFVLARDVARSLYFRLVGITLDIIAGKTQLGAGAIQRVQSITEWALRSLNCHSIVRVFTLNYDGLLSSRLLELEEMKKPIPFSLSDTFYGWYDALTIQLVPPSLQVNSHPYRLDEREFLRGGPNVVLYHLHGSLSWLQVLATSEVYKANHLDDLRNHRIFRRWAEGEHLLVRPLVVLGNNKQRAILQSPFSWAYRELHNSTSQARRVLIGGYSFGDIPLNDALRSGLHVAHTSNVNPRWLIVGHANPADVATFRRRVEAALDFASLGPRAGQYVTINCDGLTAALGRIDPAWWCPREPEQP